MNKYAIEHPTLVVLGALSSIAHLKNEISYKQGHSEHKKTDQERREWIEVEQ